MSDTRETLRRGVGDYAPQADAYRRVLQRRDRKARNRRVGAFLVVALIALTGGLAVVRELRSESTPVDEGQPTPLDGTYLLEIADGTLTPFRSPVDGWAYRFSPDGSQVAFAAIDPDGTQVIYLMDRDGADLRSITEGRFPTEWASDPDEPAWSPNGRWLVVSGTDVFSGRRQLYFLSVPVHVQTGDHSTPRSGLGFPGSSEPTWSPDGELIAFTVAAGPSIATVEPSPYLGGKSMTIEGGLRPFLGGASSLSWSNDGTRIVFVDADTGVVTIADADEADSRAISDASGANPSWSPDGTKIAYDDLSSGRIAIYDVVTGETTLTTVHGCTQDWYDDSALLVTGCDR